MVSHRWGLGTFRLCAAHPGFRIQHPGHSKGTQDHQGSTDTGILKAVVFCSACAPCCDVRGLECVLSARPLAALQWTTLGASSAASEGAQSRPCQLAAHFLWHQGLTSWGLMAVCEPGMRAGGEVLQEDSTSELKCTSLLWQEPRCVSSYLSVLLLLLSILLSDGID